MRDGAALVQGLVEIHQRVLAEPRRVLGSQLKESMGGDKPIPRVGEREGAGGGLVQNIVEVFF